MRIQEESGTIVCKEQLAICTLIAVFYRGECLGDCLGECLGE